MRSINFIVALLIGLLVDGSATAQPKNILTLVVSPFPPFIIVNKETVSGFIPDLIREAALKSGIEHKFEIFPWKRAYQTVLEGPRMAHMALARTPQRENKFQWVHPLFKAEIVFITNHSPPLGMEKARAIQTVCVVGATPMLKFLKKNGFKNIYEVTKIRTCASLLKKDRVSAIFGGWFSTLHAFKEQGLTVKHLEKGPAILSLDIYLAVSKDVDQTTVKKLRSALRNSSKDGTYNKFLSLYDLGSLTAPQYQTSSPK
ncbi:MAG: transporter substrate-binding domain-containing protein [Rhodospirillaceae bacterium]|nr:transporter substrate-binding domain-containing protein [Rhodospirillales bacterium]MBT3904377.1 transporter substrate-binding domain-containing protein [Rhodospirillaceae bacterium]MBT4702598.1 transporter substrate-binding domain-containing protein [Rhodospirillaceae bacterium]MBT5036797.1 transporter substrate-binding domain-containing protein [Rhodospirillaceae bacterium]MBT6222304.1 transporter substrate-binding domain-containing protein [Rhodospirillaceae bacterium]